MNATAGDGELLDRVVEVLTAVPAVRRVRRRTEVAKRGKVLDALLEIKLDSGALRWIVELRRRPLEPAHASLAALAQSELVSAGFGDYAVVAAPYVSPRSAEILARSGIGYCDLSGNCRFAHGSLYVERTGRPNAFARKAALARPFTPAAERVLRALLDPEHRGKAWSLRELAGQAFPGVSLGQAHKVATLLVGQAYLERKSEGLLLVDAARLLEQWRAAYRLDRSPATRYYSPLPLAALRERFSGVANQEPGEGGVMALFTAAEVLAPHVRQHRFFAYWRGDRRPLVGELELKEVGSGDNVVVHEPYDDGVFYPAPHADGPVTSPLQTYLDLSVSPARGEEAARAIYERYLRKAYAR